MGIRENVREVLGGLPAGVELEAAVKSRSPEEIREAVAAGIRIVGANYVQEAAAVFPGLGPEVRRHFIGRLQKNKVKKAVELFDLVETVDSFELGAELARRAEAAGKVMPVLVEVNSGREAQKAGVRPEAALELAAALAGLKGLRVEGLMTMGPAAAGPEELLACFRATRSLYEAGRERFGLSFRCLSMGMSDSYRLAVEAGANLVRLGTRLFGPRPSPHLLK
ncbi:MAG TPA: YggS family pyridoxal phosphate-dependent enzyme [bacterium]|uniref:Pyridoxal phosphate homeostasis protein n=1 Tax=candidate division TA06 bacterium ADurb.Bin417 TaxID=1852828 RepID=A0A1V5MGW9_UNCT6|nr:MAG: hypothetical protein BWY73_00779 [candidate division TA06 bacterium ADurb.Bin417]HNQ34783.1 YggS family pyridoxal phosphate-dependent enzyme [bacterium]HNS48379.1 YggS family pyridoxal phosphate-dependent enzyme [bacterium]